jgi:hypothetical protein
MSFTNNSPVCTAVVTLGNMDINGIVRPSFASIGGASVTQFDLAAGEELCFSIDAGLYPNSANGAAILYYSYTLTCPGEDPVVVNDSISGGTLDDGSLPPCGTGADPGGNPSDDPPHPLDVVCT